MKELSASARTRRRLLLFLVLVLFLPLVGWQGSAPEDAPAGTPPADAVPDIGALVAQATARVQRDASTSRPAYQPAPPAPSDRVSPPAPLTSSLLVSKRVLWDEQAVPYVLPSSALPLRFRVDPALVERFGLAAVVEGMSQWDGVPGSLWRTEFAGLLRDRVGTALAAGDSVVYLRSSCPTGWVGYASWAVSPDDAVFDLRYGQAALYGDQVAIAVCPRVGDEEGLRAVLAHEVGHALGMAHLCEPVDHCPPDKGLPLPQGSLDPVSGEELPACRPMQHIVRPCGISELDRQAARHLHPTLPRLSGPTAVETAARASYATTPTQRSPAVVLARADADAATLAVAASLSGAANAPLLLGSPDREECVTGAAAEELARVAADPGRVLLVGGWPPSCEPALSGWNLSVERLGGPHPIALSLEVADRVADSGRLGDAAFVVPFTSGASPEGLHLPGALPAAALGRGPLLLTAPGQLHPTVREWLLEQPGLRQIYLVGDPTDSNTELAAELGSLGFEVIRVSGSDAVTTALAAAGLEELPGPGRRGPQDRPVVLAGHDAPTDGAIAASLAARLDAPLLLHDTADALRVDQWLASHRPRGGYVVGGADAVGFPAQWSASIHVRPAPHPRPSQGSLGALGPALSRLFPDLSSQGR